MEKVTYAPATIHNLPLPILMYIIRLGAEGTPRAKVHHWKELSKFFCKAVESTGLCFRGLTARGMISFREHAFPRFQKNHTNVKPEISIHIKHLVKWDAETKKMETLHSENFLNNQYCEELAIVMKQLEGIADKVKVVELKADVLDMTLVAQEKLQQFLDICPELKFLSVGNIKIAVHLNLPVTLKELRFRQLWGDAKWDLSSAIGLEKLTLFYTNGKLVIPSSLKEFTCGNIFTHGNIDLSTATSLVKFVCQDICCITVLDTSACKVLEELQLGQIYVSVLVSENVKNLIFQHLGKDLTLDLSHCLKLTECINSTTCQGSLILPNHMKK